MSTNQINRNERGNQKIEATDIDLLSCTFKDLFIDVKQDMTLGRCSENTTYLI